MFKLEQIGERTINKIAEMALARQIEHAEKVSVKVKTDPEKLAKGLLESITIHGEGLKLNPYLRVQEIDINLYKIVVHPLKALMGNIKLIEPSQGTVHIILDETDLEQSIRAGQWIKTLERKLAMPLSVKEVQCRITEQGRININIQTEIKKTGEIKEILLEAIPTISLMGEIFLKEIQQSENTLPVLCSEIILKEIVQILNFNSFHIDGLDLKMQQLTIQSGQLILQGIAVMTRFP